VFWLIYAILLERLIEPMLVAFIVALLAKGREMIASMTLGLLFGAMNGIYLIRTVHEFGWSTPNAANIYQPLILSTFFNPVLFALGGGIARKIRLAVVRGTSASHC